MLKRRVYGNLATKGEYIMNRWSNIGRLLLEGSREIVNPAILRFMEPDAETRSEVLSIQRLTGNARVIYAGYAGMI